MSMSSEHVEEEEEEEEEGARKEGRKAGRQEGRRKGAGCKAKHKNRMRGQHVLQTGPVQSMLHLHHLLRSLKTNSPGRAQDHIHASQNTGPAQLREDANDGNVHMLL